MWVTCGLNKQIIQKYTSTGQTWISLIWRLNSKKSASKSVFLWSKGSYGFFFSAEYMWWNLFEIVSIPSIFDSDKTENVSSAFITSMIYNNKQKGQIKGYYIGAEDNSRYLHLYFFHVMNVMLISQNNRFCLPALGLSDVKFEDRRSTWVQTWAD